MTDEKLGGNGDPGTYDRCGDCGAEGFRLVLGRCDGCGAETVPDYAEVVVALERLHITLRTIPSPHSPPGRSITLHDEFKMLLRAIEDRVAWVRESGGCSHPGCMATLMGHFFSGAMAGSPKSPSVTDGGETYGGVTGGNGRYVLPCGCVPPCEGHHEDES